MEKNRSQNRLNFPVLILAIALVCAILILLDLWSKVDNQLAFPWEGPSPTPTLWWRTPQAATPTPPASAGLPTPAALLPLGSPATGAFSPVIGSPVAGSILEILDG